MERNTAATNVDGLPVIQSPVVREFLDALEAIYRPNLNYLALEPDTALNKDGLRLKRAYLALRECRVCHDLRDVVPEARVEK
jgi:hypothetical protein